MEESHHQYLISALLNHSASPKSTFCLPSHSPRPYYETITNKENKLPLILQRKSHPHHPLTQKIIEQNKQISRKRSERTLGLSIAEKRERSLLEFRKMVSQMEQFSLEECMLEKDCRKLEKECKLEKEKRGKFKRLSQIGVQDATKVPQFLLDILRRS